MNEQDISKTREQLIEIIGRCELHALGLAKTLESERQALEGQDADALDIAVSEKSKSVEELRGAEQLRKRLCVESGFPDEPDQMQKVIAWCDQHAVLANCWQQLMDVVTQCDSLNMTNGAIIRSRKQHIETSISIIRGGIPSNNIYDRSGLEPRRDNVRSIAEA
ncbi:MAG: flagella synthesis protein FlgN [Woeseiaceae bacterium]